jgi:hypothetical protein
MSEWKIIIGIIFWIGCSLVTCQIAKSGNDDWVTVFVNLIFGPIKLVCYLLWYHIF